MWKKEEGNSGDNGVRVWKVREGKVWREKGGGEE